jgi:hypothetical protein
VCEVCICVHHMHPCGSGRCCGRDLGDALQERVSSLEQRLVEIEEELRCVCV